MKHGDAMTLGAVAVLAAASLRRRGSPAQTARVAPNDVEGWHVTFSPHAPSEILFQPRVPRFPMQGQNRVTLRTSWSRWGPGYAYAALPDWQHDQVGDVRLSIYRTTLPAGTHVTPTLQDVPDVDATGEVWSLQPVRGHLLVSLSPKETRQLLEDTLDYWHEVNQQGAEGYDEDDPARYHYQSAIPGIAWIVSEFLLHTLDLNPDLIGH